MPHEFLSIYPAKLMEYCLGIGYLLLFIPFWRYATGSRSEAAVVRRAAPLARRERPAAAAFRPAGARELSLG
jgi:glycine cleavage system H protein